MSKPAQLRITVCLHPAGSQDKRLSWTEKRKTYLFPSLEDGLHKLHLGPHCLEGWRISSDLRPRHSEMQHVEGGTSSWQGSASRMGCSLNSAARLAPAEDRASPRSRPDSSQPARPRDAIRKAAQTATGMNGQHLMLPTLGCRLGTMPCSLRAAWRSWLLWLAARRSKARVQLRAGQKMPSAQNWHSLVGLGL